MQFLCMPYDECNYVSWHPKDRGGGVCAFFARCDVRKLVTRTTGYVTLDRGGPTGKFADFTPADFVYQVLEWLFTYRVIQ